MYSRHSRLFRGASNPPAPREKRVIVSITVVWIDQVIAQPRQSPKNVWLSRKWTDVLDVTRREDGNESNTATNDYQENCSMLKKKDNRNITETYLKIVDQAVDELEKAGLNTTVEAIRGEIGGSYSKICPALRIVRERRNEKHRLAETAPDLPEEVRELFEATWAQTYRVADEAAAAARRSYAEELGRKDAEIEEREAALAMLESERDAITAKLEEAKQVAHAAKLRMTELEGTVGVNERDLAILEGKLEERDLILKGLFHSDVSPHRE